jgi:hypothetical protein
MTVKKIKRSAAVERWLRQEIKEQRARYKQVEKAMNVDLSSQRDEWVTAFLERIQTRGFNVHADIRRQIKPEEIPTRPKRKYKVVF